MGVVKEKFGYMEDGREVSQYIIKNRNGMQAVVTDYGAILIALMVPDAQDNLRDVVLGYDSLESYKGNFDMLGATVGRNVNRIERGQFQIDGVTYQLDINENGNNIHSHMENGFHKVLWDGETLGENSISFFYHSPDGENGFPGNLDISVTYTVTESNGLLISYYGISDKKTLINLTNHSYFNLAGYDGGSILDTIIWIDADYYMPVKEGIIPKGKILQVKDTIMDFRKPVKVGTRLGVDNEQINLVHGGYDHNFILNGQKKGMRKAAEAKNKKTGIGMEIYTDLPGMQFYTGNTTRDIIGKGGRLITKYSGFCMEPQYYPNSINMPGVPQPLFDKGQEYKTSTLYQFLKEGLV